MTELTMVACDQCDTKADKERRIGWRTYFGSQPHVHLDFCGDECAVAYMLKMLPETSVRPVGLVAR